MTIEAKQLHMASQPPEDVRDEASFRGTRHNAADEDPESTGRPQGLVAHSRLGAHGGGSRGRLRLELQQRSAADLRRCLLPRVLPAAVLFVGYLAKLMVTRLRPAYVGALFGLALAIQLATWVPYWPNSVPTIVDGMEGAIRNQRCGNSIRESAVYVSQRYQGEGILIDDEWKSQFFHSAGLRIVNSFTSNDSRARKIRDELMSPTAR